MKNVLFLKSGVSSKIARKMLARLTRRRCGYNAENIRGGTASPRGRRSRRAAVDGAGDREYVSHPRSSPLDQPTKMFLARILGEIYRMQRHIDPKLLRKGDSTIYGLMNGIESVIDAEFDIADGEARMWSSRAQVDAMVEILSAVEGDPARKAAFEGYCDIADHITAAGLTPWQVIPILTFLKLNGEFVDLIGRMDSPHSPSEFRKFEPWNGDM